jgi:hypothetical protein
MVVSADLVGVKSKCEETLEELGDTQTSNSRAQEREKERAAAAAAKEAAIRASYDELKVAQQLCEQVHYTLQ